MADRGNVWAAMYGADEGMEGATQQTFSKTSANNRRFRSAQPPFATDDDSNPPSPNKSQLYGTNPFSSETSDFRLPDQALNSHGIVHGQRSREMFGGAVVGEEGVDSRTKRQKISQIRNTRLEAQLPGKPLKPTTRQRGDGYGQADLTADMADVADFAFQNDVQRCETFLDALSTNLKICQEKGRMDVVAKMAKKLESVIDAVNKAW